MVKEPLHNGTSLLLVCFHHLCESFSLCFRFELSYQTAGHSHPRTPSHSTFYGPTGPTCHILPSFFFLNLQPEPGRQGVGGDCCPGGCTYLLGKEPSFICFLADARKESRHKMLLKKLAEDARKLNQNICECITESTYSESLGLPFPRAGRVALGC